MAPVIKTAPAVFFEYLRKGESVLSEPSAPQSGESGRELLVERDYDRVVAIASRIVGADEARDIAQEVFAELAGRSRLPLEPKQLYLAATHRALNALRTRRRRLNRERSHFRLNLSLATHAPDPAELVERSDERARVRAVMASLPEREAEILALRYGGLKYREIADALGVDVNQVGTRLARAEQSFRKEIERVTS